MAYRHTRTHLRRVRLCDPHLGSKRRNEPRKVRAASGDLRVHPTHAPAHRLLLLLLLEELLLLLVLVHVLHGGSPNPANLRVEGLL